MAVYREQDELVVSLDVSSDHRAVDSRWFAKTIALDAVGDLVFDLRNHDPLPKIFLKSSSLNVPPPATHF